MQGQSSSEFPGLCLFSVVLSFPHSSSFSSVATNATCSKLYASPRSLGQVLSLSLSLSLSPGLLSAVLSSSNCLTAGGHLVNFEVQCTAQESETDREPLACLLGYLYRPLTNLLTPMLRRQDGNYWLLGRLSACQQTSSGRERGPN